MSKKETKEEAVEAPVQQEVKTAPLIETTKLESGVVNVIPERRTATIRREGNHEMERRRKAQMVKGIFRCYEPRGGTVEFVYREFKGDPIKKYKLKDGEMYEIPLGVAEHLRKNCAYREHKYVLDERGNPDINRVGKRIDRMSFDPVGFTG